MIESQVTMDGTIICTMQTCQGFATRKTTFPAKCDAIGGMIDPLFDPPEVIARRLEALRIDLGFKTQTAFAKKLGIDKSTYNQYAKGKRAVSFETACLIRREYGISVDWLLFGDLQPGAIQIMARIGRGDVRPEKPKAAPRQRKRA